MKRFMTKHESEIADLEDERDAARRGAAELTAERDKLRKENDLLRAQLLKYGGHSRECKNRAVEYSRLQTYKAVRCTCGWDRLRAELEVDRE